MTSSMGSGAMEIRCQRRVLANGLSVVAHEDHTCPIVAVNVWYHVGSKNERPGRTGFAHLFEHLMFEGSAHHDSGYFQPLQAAGALLNGSTNADRTNYWEVVPTGAVDLALWLESDRMGYLLPALTDAKFANQREVVLNERRQNYENRLPHAASRRWRRSPTLLYPPDHPYHWLTIGVPDDLRAATLDEVREFFATYYHPGNASLAIAGAIAPDEAFALAGTVNSGRFPPARASHAPRRWRRPLPATSGCSSRTASSSRVCIWRGTRRRCSRLATRSWTSCRTCWRAARRRVSIAGWSTRCVSPPKSRPSSNRASRSELLQDNVATAAPGRTLGRGRSEPSPKRSRGLPRKVRPTRNWRV